MKTIYGIAFMLAAIGFPISINASIPSQTSSNISVESNDILFVEWWMHMPQ